MDKVTRQNIHKCLTMLSFIKEKEELEAREIENKFKR